MSRRTKAPARGWQFWRRAFWTRPALLVLYGFLVGLLALAALAFVPDRIRDAVAMRRAAECPAAVVRPAARIDPPHGCLERVKVTLSGPWHSPGPGSTWHLMIPEDGRPTWYADADVPTLGSRRLADDAEVDALLWEGTPVAIELPSGGRVETEDWGHRGWLLMLFLGMVTASGLPMLLEGARLKRRTAPSWWSVRGEAVELTMLNPLMTVACLLGVPSLLAFFPLALGLRLHWVVTIALLGLGLTVYAVVKASRARRGRSAGNG